MIRRTYPAPRRGAVAPIAAILMVVLFAMVAFSVDVGYVAVVRNQAQNAADAAALAGMSKLAEQLKAAPIVAGIPVQTAEDLARARQEAKTIAGRNRIAGTDAEVQDADVEIGYMANPYDHSTNTLDSVGWPVRPYNAVRVTVRRDQSRTGGPVELFFARILGTKRVNVSASATAVVAMGTVMPRGNQGNVRGGLLPFAYQVDEWNALLAAREPGTTVGANGQTYTFTDDFKVSAQSSSATGVSNGSDGTLEGKLFPDRTTSGNFGTVNFSKSKVGNSTSVLRDIAKFGPSTTDWPDLADIVKASPTHPVEVNGDPGISGGMEFAVQAIIGETHILPLYSTVTGTGNNTFYRIVAFVPVTIVGANLSGNNKHISFQPRVASYKGLLNGTDRISFDVTPSATPNPLFLGARSLVR